MRLVSQRCVGPVKLEVGRFKAGPFHSERRLSQSSQVISSILTVEMKSQPSMIKDHSLYFCFYLGE